MPELAPPPDKMKAAGLGIIAAGSLVDDGVPTNPIVGADGNSWANNVALVTNSFGAKAAAPADWGNGNAWAPATAYTATTVIQPNYFNLSNGMTAIKWVCSQAGTSGNLEPDWPHNAQPGVTVYDGTAIWTATDIGSSPAINPAWAFGWWHIAQALSGQRLNEVVIHCRSGKLATEILQPQYMDRIRAVTSIGTIYYGPIFENDVSGAPTNGLAAIQTAWSMFQADADKSRAQGFKIVVHEVAPSGFYDASGSAFSGYAAGLATRAFNWLNKKIRDYCKTRKDVVLVPVSQMWVDPNPANPVWPENATTYLSASGSGQQLKKTDNIHPNFAVHWLLGQQLATIISANFLPRAIFTTHGDAGVNCTNPLNYSTGTTPSQVTVTSNGTGVTATNSIVARTDGVNGNWSQVAYAATGPASDVDWHWTTAPTALFAAGTVVQGFTELKVTANPTLLAYLVLAVRFNGSNNPWWYSSYPVGTDQDWGQFITADTVLTLKTLPLVAPTNLTTVNCYSQAWFRGSNAAGTVALGRSQCGPVQPATAP